MKHSYEDIIAKLEEKISRLKDTIVSYKGELKDLSSYKIEWKLYKDLSTLFASSETFDDFFTGIIKILSQNLDAHYYGVFWLDNETEVFEYHYGKGYNPSTMPTISQVGSLMGKSLFFKDVLWKSDLRNKDEYIPLKQNPDEYNVLCVPIILFGEDTGAIRIANIDTDSQDIGIKVLKTVNPLLCSSLERMQLQLQNKQALNALEASFSIARLLEDTLVESEILKNVCLRIPKLFPCRGCVVAVNSGEIIKPAFSWPDNFFLGGNSHSSLIYLRNLLEAFPDGNALIENIHCERRWAWPIHDVRSLCIAGFHVYKKLKGVIIAVGPDNEQYNLSHQKFLGLIASQTSITMERASYFRKQREQATCDGLTGLLNHRMFQEIIHYEIERVKRYERSLSLVMFDIDHFKKFNDNFGHPAGDEIIKMVARNTKCLIRFTDRAFRYGGEEFCVLMAETSSENAVHFAERLRRKIEDDHTVKKLTVTISLGVTGYIKGESPQDFIKRADIALYKSKKNGRNRVSSA